MEYKHTNILDWVVHCIVNPGKTIADQQRLRLLKIGSTEKKTQDVCGRNIYTFFQNQGTPPCPGAALSSLALPDVASSCFIWFLAIFNISYFIS